MSEDPTWTTTRKGIMAGGISASGAAILTREKPWSPAPIEQVKNNTSLLIEQSSKHRVNYA